MRVAAVVAEGGQPDDAPDRLVGRCGPMQEVSKASGRVAPLHATVLILGETGTGKEMVARAIYHYSRRAAGPFRAINCAAIPESLLESELFGHGKGAFTGADRRRIGKFEQCHKGTLFRDEIGDMTPLTQTKVLRVLQEQQFYAEWLALTDRDLLTRVLRHTGWNQVQAAKTLGINRSTLRARPPRRESWWGWSVRSPSGEPG
jgi:transcriptional regulator with GAF, ATPase, and Fis domain